MKNLTSKQIIDLLKIMREEGRDDVMLLNLTYMLRRVNYYQTKDDLECVYDNLLINNEIITPDNMYEYDMYKICKDRYKNYKMVCNKILNKGKYLLLNYYCNKAGDVTLSYYYLRDSFIFFDPNYNILDK